jgi:mannose-6-phosphate isomerase
MEHDERPWGRTRCSPGEPATRSSGSPRRPANGSAISAMRRREEHWLVVGGAGRATIDGDEFDVVSGTAVDVPVEAAHRIANTGTAEPLVLIEVQRGDYVGEDDIVRLEDDFGRADNAG